MEMEMRGRMRRKGEGERERRRRRERGTKTPFFDKQTGGWREVEVVDLCDD